VSALDGKRNWPVRFQPYSADWPRMFPVVSLNDVFGLGMLDGAVDFAESAAYTDFFFSDYSFHSFDASFFSKREQMITKNLEFNVLRAWTNAFYEYSPSEVGAVLTSVLLH
jgi:hypothetical protein